MQTQTQLVFKALSSIRINAMPEETDIHKAIEVALTKQNISYKHEAPIAVRCRVDFLIGTTAIEVKKAKVPRKTLLNQLERYLASPMVSEIILVSPRALSVPNTINKKPVYVYSLNKLWGIALP